MVKEEKSLLLKQIGEMPALKIIDFFLYNPSLDYSKQEVVQQVSMSRSTFFKAWKTLESSGIFTATRRIGRASMCRLNRQNPVVQKLIELDLTLGKQAMEKAVGQEVISRQMKRVKR